MKKIVAIVFICFASSAMAQPNKAPRGFKALLNGKDLRGWHISRSSHQGTTPSCEVNGGVLELKQFPYGQGGVLLTDEVYADFELYLEVKIDSFCNGGIFLRSTESGQAYQVELSEPGGTGSFFGEQLRVSQSATASGKDSVWKANDWNSFRIRMTGAAPRVMVWINEKLMYDITQPQNDMIAGATEGMIGFQVHWSATYDAHSNAFDMSGSWRPGGQHAFRNVFVRKL